MRSIILPEATAVVLGFLTTLPSTAWAQSDGVINGTSIDGTISTALAQDRTPTLYSSSFGDCLGGESLLNITNFDAALYWDNSTVLMHLDGRTNIREENLMLHFSFNAFGEDRFTKIIDPCQNNQTTDLCPMRASQPVQALLLMSVSTAQVGGIPEMAFDLPDVEGFARIQIFANSSKTEIGCFQAALKNGKTLSHPEAVGTTVGVFAVIAIVASFAAAAYGVSIPHMRTHYAHSLSVLVVFEVLQAVFFSGMLSVQWPAILPAWWSNFAWAVGLIATPQIVDSVNSFVGVSGNASQVGGAGSTVLNNNGGLTQQIYGRLPVKARDVYSDLWNGDPVQPGLPLPGNMTGFAGTLTPLAIPAQGAFIISLIWTVIAVLIIAFSSVAFKWTLEGLAAMKWVKDDRLLFYRTTWLRYLVTTIQRTCLIAFASISTLALYQFAVGQEAGAVAVAAVVFIIFLAGIGFLVWHALHTRFRHGKFTLSSDRIILAPAHMFGFIQWFAPVRLSQLNESEFASQPHISFPFFRIYFSPDNLSRQNVHTDEDYITRHGWLSARYRLSKWWFFAYWAVYQLLRACFIGGAASSPLAQVFGLFILELISFVAVSIINPYEGQRNTALAVYLLGLAKLFTTGLSISFLADFALNRLAATAVGVLIIIVQALLIGAVFILILLGCTSTFMSLRRNREHFGPEKLDDVRIRYYEHIDRCALDEKDLPVLRQPGRYRSNSNSSYIVANGRPHSRRGGPTTNNSRPTSSHSSLVDYNSNGIAPVPEPGFTPGGPGGVAYRHHKQTHSFSVSHVRRLSKIEDEEDEPGDDVAGLRSASAAAGYYPPIIPRTGRSRATSLSSIRSNKSGSGAPRGAKGAARVSWGEHDFTIDQSGRTGTRPSSTVGMDGDGENSPSVKRESVVTVGEVHPALREEDAGEPISPSTVMHVADASSTGSVGTQPISASRSSVEEPAIVASTPADLSARATPAESAQSLAEVSEQFSSMLYQAAVPLATAATVTSAGTETKTDSPPPSPHRIQRKSVGSGHRPSMEATQREAQ